MTIFVGNVGTEPARGHPPDFQLFSASLGHRDLYLLAGLGKSSQDHYDEKENVVN